MKILVLGASGMAGHLIALYLQEQGHGVTGFARRKISLVPSIIGDAADTRLLGETIAEGRFDAVINCVGILNQAASQFRARAVFLNAYLPHFLAEITGGTETQVVHMSTDCVFSGKTGYYTETSLRDGETFYDRSKALGELEERKNITLRNSIVGPDINPEGIGLLNWFMGQEGEIQGYTKAMWTGLTTLQLAKIMEQAIRQRAHGLYNMVPDHNISKYKLLGLFNRYLRDNAVTIHPFDGFSADKTLIRTRLDFMPDVPDYDTMVRELADWVREHRGLYPHYRL